MLLATQLSDSDSRSPHLHPLKSRPCRAYTINSTSAADRSTVSSTVKTAMKGDVTIRAATIDDYSAICQLLHELHVIFHSEWIHSLVSTHGVANRTGRIIGYDQGIRPRPVYRGDLLVPNTNGHRHCAPDAFQTRLRRPQPRNSGHIAGGKEVNCQRPCVLRLLTTPPPSSTAR